MSAFQSRVLVVFTGLAVVAVGTITAAFAWVPPRDRQRDIVKVTGEVARWRLDNDARFYVALESTPRAHGGGETKAAARAEDLVWFRTPANQTTTTQFEDLLFNLVIASLAPDSGIRRITLLGEDEPELDGESWETAYSIVAVTQP